MVSMVTLRSMLVLWSTSGLASAGVDNALSSAPLLKPLLSAPHAIDFRCCARAADVVLALSDMIRSRGTLIDSRKCFCDLDLA